MALEFSRRLNIRDPGKFPDVPQIQSTKLERPAVGDVQYVYREFQSAPSGAIVLSFIAPLEMDTFCPVKLVRKAQTDNPEWVDVAFKISSAGTVASQQVISGPAVVCPSTAPPPPAHRTLVNSARTIEKATLAPIFHTPIQIAGSSFANWTIMSHFRRVHGAVGL